MKLAFTAMLICTLFATELSPAFRLTFFAPFLVLTYYQKPYPKAIGYSLACGLIIDLFTSPLRFGIHALNYSLTTALIYNQKRNLFSDSLLTMPIMTYFFASLSTLIQVILLYAFSKPLAISFSWVLSDLIWMPAMDALFAFTFFVIPSFFMRSSRNYGEQA